MGDQHLPVELPRGWLMFGVLEGVVTGATTAYRTPSRLPYALGVPGSHVPRDSPELLGALGAELAEELLVDWVRVRQ